MLTKYPLLFTVSKSIRFHGNEVEAFTSKKVTNSNLIHLLLSN
jgi:hypothetical protein